MFTTSNRITENDFSDVLDAFRGVICESFLEQQYLLYSLLLGSTIVQKTVLYYIVIKCLTKA